MSDKKTILSKELLLYIYDIQGDIKVKENVGYFNMSLDYIRDYTSSKKLDSIDLYRLNKYKSYKDSADALFYTLSTDNKIVYVTLTPNGEVKGKPQEIKVSKFTKLVSTNISISIKTKNRKSLTQSESVIIKETLKKRAIELIAEEIKMLQDNKNIVETSTDVEGIYLTKVALSGTGSLSGSCMGKSSSSEGKMYLHNYNKIEGLSIVFIKDSKGKLIARALLWHDVINKENEKTFNYMDRVYGSEKSILILKKWATENGYYVKGLQGHSCSGLALPIKGKTTKTISEYKKDIKLEAKDLIGFPYSDSFSTLRGSIIHSYQGSRIDGIYNGLTSTAGHFKTHVCARCGRFTIYKQIVTELNKKQEEIYYCNNCKVMSEVLGNIILEKKDSQQFHLYNKEGDVYKFDYISRDEKDFKKIPKELVQHGYQKPYGYINKKDAKFLPTKKVYVPKNKVVKLMYSHGKLAYRGDCVFSHFLDTFILSASVEYAYIINEKKEEIDSYVPIGFFNNKKKYVKSYDSWRGVYEYRYINTTKKKVKKKVKLKKLINII